MNAVLTAARRAVTAVVVLVAFGAFALTVAMRADAVRVSRVLTGSMGKAVPAGSLAVSRPVEPEAIEPGQVVLFVPPAPFGTPGSKPIAHRVVEVTTDNGEVLIRTKGDANAGDDPWTVNASRSTVFRLGWSSALAGRVSALAGAAGASVVVSVLTLVAAARVLAAIWRPRPGGRRRAGDGTVRGVDGAGPRTYAAA